MHIRLGFPAFAAVAAVAVALLSGCFYQTPRIAEANAKAQAAYADCEKARLAGKYKTHVAAIDCAIPTVTAAYDEAAYPYVDLTYIRIQAHRIGAARIDSGDVTEAQYQHDLAELETRLSAEEARRTAATDRTSTPEPVPPDTLIAGLATFAPAPPPADLPPLPPTGACLPLGEIRPCK